MSIFSLYKFLVTQKFLINILTPLISLTNTESGSEYWRFMRGRYWKVWMVRGRVVSFIGYTRCANLLTMKQWTIEYRAFAFALEITIPRYSVVILIKFYCSSSWASSKLQHNTVVGSKLLKQFLGQQEKGLPRWRRQLRTSRWYELSLKRDQRDQLIGMLRL